MKIPSINAQSIEQKIELIETSYAEGNISTEELEIICKLVSTQKLTTIFEFGTFDGRTTINLANNTSALSKIYTLDLPKHLSKSTKYPLGEEAGYFDSTYVDKEKSGQKYLGKKGSEKIIQLYGDSATFDYSSLLHTMDFVFVDGSHGEDYVLNDTEIALKLCKEGGIIIWHDYGVWSSVTKILNKYYKEDPRFSNLKTIKGTSLAILFL